MRVGAEAGVHAGGHPDRGGWSPAGGKEPYAEVIRRIGEAGPKQCEGWGQDILTAA